MKCYMKAICSCRECPDYEYRDCECGGMDYDWCLKSKKEIPYETQTFPPWCELTEVSS